MGIKEVCPSQILRHLTVQVASDVAFSSPRVTADEILSGISHDESILPHTFKLFQRMIREFSNKERQLLLKFITGSSRLVNSGFALYVNDAGEHEIDEKLEEILKNPD